MSAELLQLPAARSKVMFLSVFGYSVVGALLWYAARLSAYPWRLVAECYSAGALSAVLARKSVQQVVVIGSGLTFRKYAAVAVEVYESGLSLSVYPFLSPFCPRLFLPFEEMSVQRTSWYLNVGCHGIRMERLNGVEIVVDDDLLNWIRSHSDRM